VDRLPLSRRAFEQRFVRSVGRSPKAEILRVQLDRVQELLRHTDLGLAAVADAAGFRHAEHMATLFKDKLGLTPGQYRRQSAPTAAAPKRRGERTA
jgi:LacI family transcriptional regulator